MNVLVLHGPNLSALGTRQPDLYGSATLAEIDASLTHLAGELGVAVDTCQSNHEGELLDRIHESTHVDGFLVNAAGLTHTSVCLRDALLSAGKPFVEVHLTNIFAREEFRAESLLSDVALGVITGFGPQSYRLGLRALASHLRGETGAK